MDVSSTWIEPFECLFNFTQLRYLSNLMTVFVYTPKSLTEFSVVSRRFEDTVYSWHEEKKYTKNGKDKPPRRT